MVQEATRCLGEGAAGQGDQGRARQAHRPRARRDDGRVPHDPAVPVRGVQRHTGPRRTCFEGSFCASRYGLLRVGYVSRLTMCAAAGVVEQEMLHLTLAGNILRALTGTQKLYEKAFVPVYNDETFLLYDEVKLELRCLKKPLLESFIKACPSFDLRRRR